MTRTTWLLTAALALTLLPSNVVPAAVPLLRGEWGVGDAELGGVFTAYRLGYLVAVLAVLPLTDRLGRAPVALGIAASSGCLSLAFGWLGLVGWWPVLVIGCLYGLLLAADSSIYSATVTEVAPPEQVGSAQAAQAFTASVASSVAPVAAGLVLDLGGGYGSAFGLAGLVGLAGALNLLPLTRKGRSNRASTSSDPELRPG